MTRLAENLVRSVVKLLDRFRRPVGAWQWRHHVRVAG